VAIAKASTASGDGQTAVVATGLPDPLRVLVTEDGSPVSGRMVTWATTGGSVTGSSDTDAAGIAASQWTLGQSAGLQSASATLSGAGGSPVGFTATASAGAAASLAESDGDGQSGLINTALANPLLARATDQFGNSVSGVNVMWQVTSGTAMVSPASSSTGSSGEAQTTVTLGGTAGPIIIQAMNTGLSGSPVSFTATATTLPTTVTVQLLDAPTSFSPQHITIAANGTVTWTWSSGGMITHNVVPDATEPATSGAPVPGPNTYQFTFTMPGTYMYYCEVHGLAGGSGMFGTVTVM
jgi:plastocyanin